MGVFGFVAAGGGTVGVLLGGVITDVLSWHWIFLVNVPIGIAVFVLARASAAGGGRAGEYGTPRRRRRVVVTGSLMLAVYAIVNGNQWGWATLKTIGLLVVAAGADGRRSC